MEPAICTDRGGNIMGLNRLGNNTAGLIDNLAYQSETVTRPDYINPGSVTRISSNKLLSVSDAAPGTEGMPTGVTAYTYDGDGNLDTEEDNKYIWCVSGKLARVENKNNSTDVKVRYLYVVLGIYVVRSSGDSDFTSL